MSSKQLKSARQGPLDGLLVLDFGQAAVGPIAAEYLGMLGATVIKVESPRGDMVRQGSPLMKGTGTTFIGNNLGKFGMVLDLKSSEDLEKAKNLIRIADVLIENFRSSDVMVRLGLGYDVLKDINPDLVYVSSSAYGSGGPLENMRSNEWLSEALSGFASVTGAEDGAGEISRGTANLDWNGAMMNTVVILAALVRRANGKSGCYCATSQFGSSVYGGITRFAEVLAGQSPGRPLGTASTWMAPDEAFQTLDGYIAVSAPTQQCWLNLIRVLGLDSLQDDPRFSTNHARVNARVALCARLSERFSRETSAEWHERLIAAHVPCAVVHRSKSLLEMLDGHPQIAATGALCRIASPYGPVASQAPHWTFSRSPAAIPAAPPLLGEHASIVDANLHDKQALIHALKRARVQSQDQLSTEAV